MNAPVVYFAITNHGFGHAVRVAAVAAELKRLNPKIVLIIATSAPRWLFESYIEGDFIHRVRSFDIGVVQSDSLHMDLDATLEILTSLEKKQDSIIASEASFLKTNRVSLVLGDIPPMLALIAKAANVPCWMMSNFGWDLIYQQWGERFQASVDWITSCYRQCNHLFRLPLHEPMSSFSSCIDVGLTGGNPKYSMSELREKFDLKQPTERTSLIIFGGLGLEFVPYHTLSNFPDWQFITFDSNAPKIDNLRFIAEHQYRPVDFMPLCSQVVSKPGYGTFAEAIRLDIPIVTIQRSDFAETPFLLEGLQDYSQHRILDNKNFFLGNWEFLEEPLDKPRSQKKLAIDGSELIAKSILEQIT
jgi:hypothetical protein